MKKNVLVFGCIAGLLVSVFMVISTTLLSMNQAFDLGMLLGYASMLIAFSFVFVGTKNYRDKYRGGVITFGKALSLGLLIALVASTFYVLTWLVEYYLFIPDFMEKYSAYVMAQAEKSGASAMEIEAQRAQMSQYSEMYKNPLWVILLTYMEILPIGILVALISALVLRKKPATVQPV